MQHHQQKRYLGILVTLFSCVYICFSCGRSGPPPDRTPPRWNFCPSDQFLTGIAGQLYAFAEWAEPNAYDDRDGKVSVSRDGKPPRSHFGHGTTVIRYTAKDRSGNMAPPCSFRIVVNVIQCPKPAAVANGFYLCHPQNPFVLGSVCRFACYDGFDLDGPKEITCLRTGSWSDRQSQCSPRTCSQLPIIPKAKLNCTNGNKFRSVCSYICDPGYDMPKTTARALICTLSGTWRKNGEPECKDVEPPVFQTCPSVIIEGADNGAQMRPVTWPVPKVTDNYVTNIVPKLARGYGPGSLFSIGTHEIVYVADDYNGNGARPCAFKVVVKEIRCQKLYPTPYMSITCSAGYTSGSSCTFICDPGKILDGSNVAMCSKDPEGLFGSWSWAKSQPKCKDGKECEQLEPPKNGAVVCDIWGGGKFCQFQCMNGTNMMEPELKQLFFCLDSGTWHPRSVKDLECQKPVRGVNPTAQGVIIYYGYCSDTATQEMIRRNFQKLVEADVVSSTFCSASTLCNVGNIQVRCGNVSVRKRRVVQAGNQIEVIVSVQLPSSLEQTFQTDYDQITTIFQHLEYTLSNLNSSAIVDGLELTFVGIQNKTIGIECPVGTIPAPDMYACVNCSAGTFYNSTSMSCVACNKGWYQELTGQLSCKACPEFTSTRTIKAVSEEACESACEPGYWSVDGVTPCSPCDAGTYQEHYGQIHCIRCPGSQTTLSLAATTPGVCQEFDIIFPPGQSKNCFLKVINPVNTSSVSLTLWIQIRQDSSGKIIHLLNGNEDILSLDLDREWKVSINGEIHAFTLPLPDERWHSIALVQDNCSSTLYVDSNVSVIHHGCVAKIQFDTIVLGNDDFVGSISQMNAWSTNNVTQRRYMCFTGTVGDLIPWNFFEDSTTTGAYMQISSSCDDIDECSSIPCVNGTCTDGLHSFTCTCNTGFTGTNCDFNVDDCEVNVCMNGSTCVDEVEGYACICPPLYTGEFCEIEMVDGEWGTWSNWSDCSVTCDLGVRTRTRLCDSPAPDNDGHDCIGNGNEIVTCNETACPVCVKILPPVNGNLSCTEDSNSINCTVHCNTGYVLDIEPLDSYICGEETSFKWNFDTEDNPLRRLPKCTAIHHAKELEFTLNNWYQDLSCKSVDASEVMQKVRERSTEVIHTIGCINQGLCSLKGIEILNCVKERTKRETGGSTVGFSITVSSNPATGNSSLIIEQMDKAYSTLVRAAETGNFTVELKGTPYHLQTNSTDVSLNVMCPDNLMKVDYFCIPCGEGSYLSDGYCQQCGYGYYQDKQGQSSCTACPQDWTTEGKGSISVEDCTVYVVPQTTEHEQTKAVVVIACSVTAVVIIIAIFVVLILKHFCKQKNATKVKPDVQGMYDTEIHDNVEKAKSLSREVTTLQRELTITSIEWMTDTEIQN